MQLFQALYSLLLLLMAKLLSFYLPYPHKLFLVGSNYGESIDPNAGTMVSYLHDQDIDHALVCNHSSAHKEIKRLLPRATLDSARAFLAAEGCFYTHSLSDIVPYAHKFSAFSRVLGFPSSVFLQHGVLGLKKDAANGVSMEDYLRSLEPTFDWMVVSSKWEQMLVENMSIPANKIALTGLPRFDNYQAECKKKLTVLVFFTWQNQSRLNERLSEVHDSGVLDLLRERGLSIVIAKHQMQPADHRYTECVSSGEELQVAIRECALLITDESSIAWDVWYLGGEVVFYSPKPERLLELGSLSLRTCYNSSDLRQLVSVALDNGFSEAPPEIPHSKGKNAQRVFELIGD